MRRHPQVSSASPASLSAFHEELKRTPQRWRACPPVRIEPCGSKYREVRRCPGCSAELVRPLQSLVLRYADQDSAAVLPLASMMLTVPVDTPLAEIQRAAVMQIYELVGSVQTAAQLLGVSRRTLYNWCPNLSDPEAEPMPCAFSILPPARRVRR